MVALRLRSSKLKGASIRFISAQRQTRSPKKKRNQFVASFPKRHKIQTKNKKTMVKDIFLENLIRETPILKKGIEKPMATHDSLSLSVFTGARIEGEECSTTVDSGPESLAKVEIVVLEGDFDSDETENWNVEEFKNNIVREREGKKPLLTGESILNLKDGVCSLGEIAFTDNASWFRSRIFRIGARVIDNFDGIKIREARTESFIVRDHRGELYKKHHPPSLLDEVWRLEKIGKDGAFHKRLSRENIHTAKDFLTLLHIDPSRLRYILGTGMSAKMWEVTVERAHTCVIDKRVYLYCPPTSHLKTSVVFNLVGQVMGLLSDCQYVPIEKLFEAEKVDAHNLVISAFQHWEEVVSFDEKVEII
ncbi:hypothetical protein ACJRO7_024297 [Eucalyptus globulus]|uniref:Calmodulin-binding protein 60 A-like n=1 Tax=Eucalyptus globulus TaxID=34317 RepID=A0ABD3KHJ4_EUCGL